MPDLCTHLQVAERVRVRQAARDCAPAGVFDPCAGAIGRNQTGLKGGAAFYDRWSISHCQIVSPYPEFALGICSPFAKGRREFGEDGVK